MVIQGESQHKEKISNKIQALNEKIPCLAKSLAVWKSQLEDDHDFQQFNWKADVVEAWIGMMCEDQRLPSGTSGKEHTCQCRRRKRCEFDPWVGKIPWRRAWQPTSVFLPEGSHGQRSLAVYIPVSQRVRYN